MEDQVLGWVAAFSYPAVLLLLLGTGLGAPVSEELVLLAGGLAVSRGASLWLMLVTGVLGVLAADGLLYRIGQRLGPRALGSRRLQRLLTERRVSWVQRHFERWGPLTIFVARFLPGLRAPTFLIAGMLRMPARGFFVADALGALITAPAMVLLGYHFGLKVLGEVESAGKVLAGAALAAMLGIAALTLVRRRRRREEEARRELGRDRAA